MKLNKLFKISLLNLFVILLSLNLIAQPGDLSRSFSPYDTCHIAYFKTDYVFVGRVESVLSKGSYRIGDSEPLSDYKIKIEDAIKGDLGESVILTTSIISQEDIIGLNERYIFTAMKNKDKRINGEFISGYWSKPTGNIPTGVLEEKVEKVKRVIQGKEEPRIIGKVVLQNPNPAGNYKYQYYDKIFGLGFDPQYSTPLEQIEVIAISENGKKYHTFTDKEGNFKYMSLPMGSYLINLSLPNNYKIMSSHGLNHGNFGGSLRDTYGKPYVSESPCSSTADFAVSPVGNLQGKISLQKGKWDNIPNVAIIAVNPENYQLYENFGIPSNSVQLSSAGNEISFSFKDVPVGKYVIAVNFSSISEFVYFPTIKNGIVEGVISIQSGDNVQVSFKH